MKEIGGYFGLEQFHNSEYYKELIALNTGRNALLYLIKARKINKIYIPYYLCDSISSLCHRECFEYEYYHVYKNFKPDFNKILEKDEYLYIVNYYGQISNNEILSLKEKYSNIIIDNTQAFFQQPIFGIDTIYSCRKYFGVPDGAYLATDCNLSEELETDISKNRMKHLLGRFELNGSEFYTDFKSNDDSFYNEPLKRMSKLTHNILSAIDYESVIQKRNQNYVFLSEELKSKNNINFLTPIAPFTYPFYCKNGITIRKILAEKKIYIPTLWPDAENCNELEQEYIHNILPLPCDQRYDIEDMKRIVKEVLLCSN